MLLRRWVTWKEGTGRRRYVGRHFLRQVGKKSGRQAGRQVVEQTGRLFLSRLE